MKIQDVPAGSKIEYFGTQALVIGCRHPTYNDLCLIGWKAGEDRGGLGFGYQVAGKEAEMTKLGCEWGCWLYSDTEVELVLDAPITRKYQGVCPCGIDSQRCDYHKE